jgi:uncharacterized protein (TIGR02145 family)
MVSLGNVDDTNDASKPISTATQTALDLKATITALNTKLNISDFPSGSNVNEILYWNGSKWVSLQPGTTGQSIIMTSTGLSWGCIITNTAGTASSTPTLNAYSALTPITHSTSGAAGIGTATGLPAGVSASWTANTITISGTPSSAGSFTYTIPLTGGCGSVNATGTITVSAGCAASTASTTPTLTVNTVLTNITHATISATGIGTASGLPAGVSAVWSGNVITISGTPTNTGTFNYTIPLTGTSCSGVNATGTITVSACGSVTSVTIEGYSYPTVSIGTQCWTKENLKVTTYNDGTALPLNNTYTSGTVSTVWQGLTTGSYTIYGNESSTGANATNYGFLYNWYAAKGIATSESTTYKNICPDGWHVPTDTEWTTLTSYLNTAAPAWSVGGKMKSIGTTLWNSPNLDATNASGFSALPGGYRSVDGSFGGIRNNAYFWSATENGPSNARNRVMFWDAGGVYRDHTNFIKSTGAAVRCLKN